MSNLTASTQAAADCCINDAFTAILSDSKKTGKLVAQRKISAKEFIQSMNRARDVSAQKELILAYTGSYVIREPHGVQLDNAMRQARQAVRPATINVPLTLRTKNQINPAVADLLRKGQDLKARINNAEELEYSEETVIGMKRELAELENALEAFAN